MARLWRMALVLCFALHASLTFAQEDPSRSASARTLFEEGVQQAEQGQWESAADRFRRALTLRDSHVIRFNLAVALCELGHVVEASELFQMLLRADGVDATLHAQAEQRLAMTTPRIAKLTVQAPASDADFRVELDGRLFPVELIGMATPVDPGTHALRLMRGESELDAQQVAVEPGASAAVTLSPRTAPSAAQTASAALLETDTPLAKAPVAPGAPRKDDAPQGRRTKLLWWGIGGGAALVVGAVLAGVLLSRDNKKASPYRGDFEPGSVKVQVAQ